MISDLAIYNMLWHEKSLKVISKMHLTSNYGVAGLCKMLMYSPVWCAFTSARALSLKVSYFFEMICI